MKKLVQPVVIGMLWSVLSQADVVTFNEYADGTVLNTGTALGSNFVYQKTGLSSSNVVNGQALTLYSGTDTFQSSWVRDTSPTAYNSLAGEKWYRSVDIALSSTVTAGSGQKMSVALVNGPVANGADINITAFNANYVTDVQLAYVNATTATLMLRRFGSGNVFQGYNWTSGLWVTGANDVVQYDISHTLNIGYVYDSSATQFSLLIQDMTSSQTVLNISMAGSDLASFAGGTNTVMFAVGDMWNNSGSGAIATIDNLSTVPEPATLTLFGFAGIGIWVLRKGFLR
jgi:hypothetical protein